MYVTSARSVHHAVLSMLPVQQALYLRSKLKAVRLVQEYCEQRSILTEAAAVRRPRGICR